MTEIRKSPYNPIYVAKRDGISIEEAESVVADLKLRTSGSLKSFTLRYGDDIGTQKYNEFCKKSANTKEKYIKKYGEEFGIIEWEKYLKTKDSRSPEFFKRKFGDNWEQLYTDFISNWSKKVSLDGYIDKYGEDIGIEKFKIMSSKKANTLDKFIRKYGDGGEQKFLEYRLSKDSSSLDSFIRKFGEELGKEKFEEKSMVCSGIFCELKKLYSYEDAVIKYKQFKINKKSPEFSEIVSIVSRKWFKNPNKTPVSKSSILFFDTLKEFLKCDMQYGSKKDELKLFDTLNFKSYLYDCYIPKYNLILEYHGSAYHYHESFGDNWEHIYGTNKSDVIRHQNQKKQYAEHHGYRVIEVWDFEVSSKNRMYNKIKEIIYECNKTVV